MAGAPQSDQPPACRQPGAGQRQRADLEADAVTRDRPGQN